MLFSMQGFYGEALFHDIRTVASEIQHANQVKLILKHCKKKKDKQFSEQVLSKFQRDEVGKICQNDPTILLIGSVLFEAIKKPDRIMETKTNVMNDMRLLARFYQVIKETAECKTAEDMFVRKNSLFSKKL